MFSLRRLFTSSVTSKISYICQFVHSVDISSHQSLLYVFFSIISCSIKYHSTSLRSIRLMREYNPYTNTHHFLIKHTFVRLTELEQCRQDGLVIFNRATQYSNMCSLNRVRHCSHCVAVQTYSLCFFFCRVTFQKHQTCCEGRNSAAT